LTAEERRQVLFVGAVFGAIRIAAENGRFLYGAKMKKSGSLSAKIPLPDL
jgi:hypothetical protein